VARGLAGIDFSAGAELRRQRDLRSRLDADGVLFVTDAGGFPQIHRWREGDGITQLTAEPRGARAPALLQTAASHLRR